MNRANIKEFYGTLQPDEVQSKRMLDRILSPENTLGSTRKAVYRRAWIAVPATCIALLFAFIFVMPFGGGTLVYAVSVRDTQNNVVRIADNENLPEDYGTSVVNVTARPALEFFIDGDNIAKIELSCNTEFLDVADWTKTQQVKYWADVQNFGESEDFYSKSLTFNFDKSFSDYGGIWYRWTAVNLMQWASEDHYSHILGGEIQLPEDATEEEKAALAAGNDGSGIGHIQLDGCPEELTKDQITMKITDRQGKSVTKIININISNNALKQTVVTASLVEQ